MNHITSNPKILGGKPIIRNTRLSVDFILELLASGMKEEKILQEYPQLKRGDIRAVLEYAARSIKREEVVLTK